MRLFNISKKWGFVHMKKIILSIVLIFLSNISNANGSWTVRSNSSGPYIPLMDLVDQIDGNNWSINGVLTSKTSDPVIRKTKNATGSFSFMEVVPGDLDKNMFELFKLDCELSSCTMNGLLSLGFEYYGMGYRLEPIFHLNSYEVSDDQSLPSVEDIFKLIIGQKVVHEQPVKYIDHSKLIFNWDPDDTWYPEQVVVRLQWENRSETRDFVLNCFEKCAKLRVFGIIDDKHGGHGDLVINADRIDAL